MDDKEISLELTHDYGSPIAMTDGDSKREPDYPTFHYEGKEDLDLPEEGEMTIKFRKVSSTSSVNKKGEHRYACTIEVQSVCDVEGEEEPDEMYSAGSSKESGDALDEIRKLLEEHNRSEENE